LAPDDPLPPRAALLRDSLDLTPHPEGGFFREHYRADPVADGRAACTAIWFLLPEGACAAWHRVAQDELWHHHEGADSELHLLDEAGYRVLVLGPVAEHALPCRVVPGGTWQAARPRGGWTLVGNTVAPGFELADWVLADDAARAELGLRHPEARAVLEALKPR
jgi:predicted cupin superfamily sugar epimerase